MEVQFLAVFFWQFNVLRNKGQQLTLHLCFYIYRKNRGKPNWLKCNNWFLRKAGLFIRKKTTINFSMSILKTCDTMMIPRSIYSGRWSANRKMLIQTTIGELDEVVFTKNLSLTIQTNHMKVQFFGCFHLPLLRFAESEATIHTLPLIILERKISGNFGGKKNRSVSQNYNPPTDNKKYPSLSKRIICPFNLY